MAKTSATVAEAVAKAEGLDFNKSLVGYQFAQKLGMQFKSSTNFNGFNALQTQTIF